MQELNNLLSLIDAHFGGSQWFVFLLLGTGLFFTVYLRFPQLRFFGHAIKVVRGKYDNKQDMEIPPISKRWQLLFRARWGPVISPVSLWPYI